MLLNTFTAAAPSPATVTDPVLPDGVDVPAATASPAPPLQGRALLAQLEALAQRELVQLYADGGIRIDALPGAMDPTLVGLAWDLGLCGAVAAGVASSESDPA